MRTIFKLRWLLLAAWLLGGLSVSLRAERVTSDDARQAAQTFLMGCGGRSNDASELIDVTVALGYNNLYAFNGAKGYVVLATDNRVNPVLAFSVDGHLDPEHTPDALRGWFDDYEQQIQYISENRIAPEEAAAQQWQTLIEGNFEGVMTRETLGPLIWTGWGVDSPFNSQCPFDPSTGYQCTTGSVATAMAKIMKYWEHPRQGKGAISYMESNYGQLSANCGETLYDWKNMLDHYVLGLPSEEEINAVATLMKHCGYAAKTHYDYDRWLSGHNGSYSKIENFDTSIQEALANNFYYKCPHVKVKDGSTVYPMSYTDEQWVQMVKDALSANPPRPILYAAYDSGKSRAQGMVCDGYKRIFDTDYIHIVTESLFCDSYCRVNVMYLMPQGGYFDREQRAYFDIQPDSANVTVAVSPINTGIVTGIDAGRYPKGDVVTLTAVPGLGMEFESWYKIENGISYLLPNTPAEYTFVVDKDVALQANFKEKKCIVNATIDPAGAGTVVGEGTYDYLEYCRLMALPNVGYSFVGWYEDGKLWNEHALTAVHVNRNYNLVARFASGECAVEATCFPTSWGSVSGVGSYPANSMVTLTATPTSGHRFLGWVENGTVVSMAPSYTFKIGKHRSLVACFGSADQFGIGSVVTNADGSKGVVFYLDPSGVEGWMVALNDVSEGCEWGPNSNILALNDLPSNNLMVLSEVSGFLNTGLIRKELGTDNGYAASLVDYEHGWYLPAVGQLRKIYSALPFIEEAITNAGGTTIADGTYWSSTEFSASEAATPAFSLGNSSKTSNCRVRAVRNFMVGGDNRILVEANDSRFGLAVVNGDSFNYGANVIAVANANPGYLFDHWEEEGLPVSYDRVYQFPFKRSRRLTAHFVLSGGVGTLVHNLDGSDGVVFYMNPEGTEGLMVALEDASEGCQWGVESNVIPLPDRPYNNLTALEDMSGYNNTGVIRTYQNNAEFAAGVVDYDNGWYLPSAGELRKLYAALPMIETALIHFGGSTLADGLYWSSTEYSTSDATTLPFNMGNTAKTSTCRVRAIRKFQTSSTQKLVVLSCDTLVGTVTGSGEYELNAAVTVSAHPKPGYVFHHWSEEGQMVSMDAQYHFTFTRNRILVAHFIVAGAVGSIVHNADGSKGVVFYQNPEGTEGLMVALHDASDGCQWGPAENNPALHDHYYNNILAIQDFSGFANTDLIRKFQGANNDYAAGVVDFNNGWYLPSAGQLRKLYAALPMIEQSLLDAGGTLLAEGAYWSSTEYNATDAFAPSFAMSTISKTSTCRVRAIRSFNCTSLTSVRLKANNPAFGGVTGAGEYQQGATVRVNATPAAGYVFDHWEEEGAPVSYDQLYSFKLNRTRSLVAVFVKEYSVGTIVHNADGTTGVIFYTNPSGVGGLMVALEDASDGCPWGPNEDVLPMENQSPSAVMDLLNKMDGRNNTSILRGWFQNDPSYAACKVDFEHGWFLPSAGQLRKLYAALPFIEKSIVIAGGTTLSEGAYWSSTEQSESKAWTPAFAMNSLDKSNNCRVRAIRSLTNEQPVTVSVNIEGCGDVSGAGEYAVGQTCTLKATPYPTVAFESWTRDGVVVSTEMEYTFMVTEGRNVIMANFVEHSENVIAKAEPAKAGVTTGTGVYGIGTECVITAEANEGYTFTGWTKDDALVSTESSLRFTVNSQATYCAHFTANNYTVEAVASPSIGGMVTGADTYAYGTEAVLTATPNEGFSFVNWTENGAEVSTSLSYRFVVRGDSSLKANFRGESYNIAAYSVPGYGGSVNGSGTYGHGETVTLEAQARLGYEFSCWYEEDTVFSYEPTIQVDVIGDRALFALFAENDHLEQTTELAQGWNWYSCVVDLNGVDGLAMLKNELGSNAVSVNYSATEFTTYGNNGWEGTLQSINNESMYKIRMQNAANITMTGGKMNPDVHPITLKKGWNPIGFVSLEPMFVTEALANLQAVPGDVVKTQTRFAYYFEGHGWCGSLMHEGINPGDGLMFKSASDHDRTFSYSSHSYGSSYGSSNDSYHWNNDVHAYSSNMTMLATVMLDEAEINSAEYELAAFVGDECRGCTRIMYVEPMQKYMAFLTVAGDETQQLRFMLYNTLTGKVVDRCDDQLNFTPDGVVGAPNEPLKLNFYWQIGVGETTVNARVYPNPTDGRLIVEASGMNRVMVTNVLGQVVHDTFVDGEQFRLDLRHCQGGVYMVHVYTEQGTAVKRITLTR